MRSLDRSGNSLDKAFMEKPLVSVNIPAYNSGEFIERTVTSALRQTYGTIEVIVLDDGSTDNTADIVKRLQRDDSRIRYYYQENRGLASSRNRLFEFSQGEYIAFLDHDDEWYPEKLDLQAGLLRDAPDTALVFSDLLCEESEGPKKSFRYFDSRRPRKGRIFYDFLLSGNFIPLSSVLVKAGVLKNYLPFSKDFKIAEEWELFLRMSRDFSFDYIDRVCGVYRLHNNRTTNKNPLLEFDEILKILDYWQAKDGLLRTFYRNKFLFTKAGLNLQKAYFHRSSSSFYKEFKELLSCVLIYPLGFEFYPKLARSFFSVALNYFSGLLGLKSRVSDA